MPRPGPVRPKVTIRLDEEIVDLLNQRATDEELPTKAGEPNRSELIRLLIAHGLEHMPAGWRPEGWEYRG
jgi:metal-responsive CopG/Arc/MetJ family transcriptional regulator